MAGVGGTILFLLPLVGKKMAEGSLVSTLEELGITEIPAAATTAADDEENEGDAGTLGTPDEGSTPRGGGGGDSKSSGDCSDDSSDESFLPSYLNAYMARASRGGGHCESSGEKQRREQR